jgi:hypothetical protein
MANPMPAFRNTFCAECAEHIPEGDDVYFTDEGKLCESCAEENGWLCDCGGFKKQEYDTCYECF